MPKLKLRKDVGIRQRRVNDIVRNVVKLGPAEAKRMLLSRWKISLSVYEAMQTEAYAILQQADVLDPVALKAELIAKLRDTYVKATPSVKVRVVITLARLCGCLAPVKFEGTIHDSSQVPQAVQAMLHDPERLAFELSQDEKHLAEDQPPAPPA